MRHTWIKTGGSAKECTRCSVKKQTGQVLSDGSKGDVFTLRNGDKIERFAPECKE